MIRISPEQRCCCRRRPVPSGSFYFGREKCRACNGFIVRSPYELAALKQQELDELEDEQGLAIPGTGRGGVTMSAEEIRSERVRLVVQEVERRLPELLTLGQPHLAHHYRTRFTEATGVPV